MTINNPTSEGIVSEDTDEYEHISSIYTKSEIDNKQYQQKQMPIRTTKRDVFKSPNMNKMVVPINMTLDDSIGQGVIGGGTF